MRDRYKITTYSVHIRETPSSKSSIKGYLSENDEFVAVGKQTLSSGAIWLQIEGTGYWCCHRTSGGKMYSNLIDSLEELPLPEDSITEEPDKPVNEGYVYSNYTTHYCIVGNLTVHKEPKRDSEVIEGITIMPYEDYIITDTQLRSSYDGTAVKPGGSQPTGGNDAVDEWGRISINDNPNIGWVLLFDGLLNLSNMIPKGSSVDVHDMSSDLILNNFKYKIMIDGLKLWSSYTNESTPIIQLTKGDIHTADRLHIRTDDMNKWIHLINIPNPDNKTTISGWACAEYGSTGDVWIKRVPDNEQSTNISSLYEVIVDEVLMYSSDNTSSSQLGHLYKGQTVLCVEQKGSISDGIIWLKTTDGFWVQCYTNSSYQMSFICSTSDINSVTMAEQLGHSWEKLSGTTTIGGFGNNPFGHNGGDVIVEKKPTQGMDNKRYTVVKYIPREYDYHNPRTYDDGMYPKVKDLQSAKSGTDDLMNYNYYMDTNTTKFREMLDIIHAQISHPFMYDRTQLGELYYKNFNRFKLTYPDFLIKQTVPVIFITRPNLNIMESGITPLSQTSNDPILSYLVRSSPHLISSLTKDYIYGNGHVLNPLLSNLCESLDVNDEYIDVFETGETFTGFKTAYAKSNIKSMTAGQISVKFKETYDISVTKLIQAWIRYENGVYRGELMPKLVNIYTKQIDYACNIYYFLLDPDMETIRFWTKYYGCFPVNVSKSIFTADLNMASSINTSEVNTTFQYFRKRDFDVTSIIEFNMDSGHLGSKYEEVYNPDIGHSGLTWVGNPFVDLDTKVASVGGYNTDAFKLRWKPSSGLPKPIHRS